ncbi:MAG: HPP family protein [Candidatus Manganitrophus sp.]|nr:HPP family protein [Candidatus Manganitrophus sp.]WDT69607.1 MAG: HPP family protein [Candidatus Manganitrophus sp.]WDT78792.1 MAG: HPP family protein [Candidatus Manganitrophus sp.]
MLGGQAKQWNRSREAEQSEQVQVLVPDRRSHLIDLGLSAVGAAIGIALTLWLVANEQSPFLLASLGGTTVFLFALGHTEPAQPRALFGGHLGGAFIGIVCYQLFGDALWVSVLAVVLTMIYMVITRTIHPPPAQTPCSWFTITPILWFSSIRSAPAFSRSFWLRCSGVAFGLGRNIR